MRLRLLVLLLALLLPAGALAGCSDDEPKPAKGPGLPSQADLESYFEAITGADVDELARVETDIAGAGSPAQGYAAYVKESTTAADNAGSPGDPFGVEAVDGGFKACAGDSEDQCATWADLRGKDGRLTDFTINGSELTDLLVDLTGQTPVKSRLYEVQPRWAYLQPRSGSLLVVCLVTAGDVPLSPKTGVYIEGDQIFKGTKTEALSPATVDAHTSSPVVLVFPDARDAELTGEITFDLGLDGQGTETIGFGLVNPAA